MSDTDTIDYGLDDLTESGLHDRLAEVRDQLADDDGYDYDDLSQEEDAIEAELASRKKAREKAKPKPKAEEPAPPSTISQKLAALQADLTEVEEILSGIERKPHREFGKHEVTIAKDAEGNPTGTAEVSVVSSADRAGTFMRAQRLREQIAELERRQQFESMDDKTVMEAAEDAAIERERLKAEVETARREGRNAAARKAERLLGELEPRVFPLMQEHQTRKGRSRAGTHDRAMVQKKAIALREQRVAEWAQELAKREANMIEAAHGRMDREHLNMAHITEAQTQLSKWEKVLNAGGPPSKEELEMATAAVEANPAIRVVGPSAVEASW